MGYGPLDVLTNGTQITSDKAKRLREIEYTSKNPLRLRVSMEHFKQTKNDQIRGENSYWKAIAGIKCLAQAGFSPILTVMRTWEDELNLEMESQK